MACVNCEDGTEAAFTLVAHVQRGADDVDLAFCSVSCLREWTTVEKSDAGVRPASGRTGSRGRPSGV